MTVHLAAWYQVPLSELALPPPLLGKLRRADAFTRLGVAAAAAVLERTTAVESEAAGYGLILATAYGTMETNFAVLEQIVDGQQTSPTLFSHSVFNAAAGYIATVFGIRGAALTLTDFSFPFFRALAEGAAAVAAGNLRHCLVLQVEGYSELLAEARQRLVGGGAWPPGVVCWLLSATGNGPLLVDLSLTDRPLEPLALLRGGERLFCGGVGQEMVHPLAAAMAVTADLGRDAMVTGEGRAYRLEAPWGQLAFRLESGNGLGPGEVG